jgi:hypothetical protein
VEATDGANGLAESKPARGGSACSNVDEWARRRIALRRAANRVETLGSLAEDHFMTGCAAWCDASDGKEVICGTWE